MKKYHPKKPQVGIIKVFIRQFRAKNQKIKMKINIAMDTSLLWRRFVAVILVLAFSNIALSNERDVEIDALLDGLHLDAHEGSFHNYFARYSPEAIFLGTDKTERWTIEEFKNYAKPAFADGHGWTYAVVDRNWEGSGNTRWFDEILFNEKLGHCRGTGVVQLINGEWKIAHYALTMLVPNAIAADVGSQTRGADKQESIK